MANGARGPTSGLRRRRAAAAASAYERATCARWGSHGSCEPRNGRVCVFLIIIRPWALPNAGVAVNRACRDAKPPPFTRTLLWLLHCFVMLCASDSRSQGPREGGGSGFARRPVRLGWNAEGGRGSAPLARVVGFRTRRGPRTRPERFSGAYAPRFPLPRRRVSFPPRFVFPPTGNRGR